MRAPERRLSGAGHRSVALACVLVTASCADEPRPAPADTVVVYVAASLAKPMRAVADAFSSSEEAAVLIESGGSLEHARKVTELGRIPDVLILADHEVFPQLLMPAHVDAYTQFARNRMVVAYTGRSRHAREISTANWYQVLQRPDVEIGRPDPERAPAGYRTLLLLQLAESHYRAPALASRILARAPSRNVRGNAAELAGLLELGEVDYIFEYESLARSHGFRFVRLPAAIDLGDPEQSERYATATVRVAARSPTDSVTFAGAPILYGVAVARRAPHAAAGRRFIDFLLNDGAAMLRDANVDVMEVPRIVRTFRGP